MTAHSALILGALLATPERELYGLEVIKAAGLKSGTVYPLLARLEGYGWLESRAEGIDPCAEHRPPRRYYRLTEAGSEAASAEAARSAAVLAALAPTLRVDPDQPPGTIKFGPLTVTGIIPDARAEAPAAACAHPRVRVKGVCPDCSQYVASKKP